MVVDDLFSVIHVTDLDCVQLTICLSFSYFGKCLSTRAGNLCPILVLTFLLNEGLYQSCSAVCFFVS